VEKVLREGAAKARAEAQTTMALVRSRGHESAASGVTKRWRQIFLRMLVSVEIASQRFFSTGSFLLTRVDGDLRLIG
jgi:hypothetical protein